METVMKQIALSSASQDASCEVVSSIYSMLCLMLSNKRAVESSRLAEHSCVFAHAFTSRDTRIKGKSICSAKPSLCKYRNGENSTLICARRISFFHARHCSKFSHCEPLNHGTYHFSHFVVACKGVLQGTVVLQTLAGSLAK